MKTLPPNSKLTPFLFAIIGAIAVFAIFEGGVTIHAQGPSDNIRSIVAIPPEVLSTVTGAIRNRPANVLVGSDLQIISFKQSGNWALSTVALRPSVPDEGESLLYHSTLVLASLSQGKWAGAIMGTAQYQQLLDLAPDALVPYTRKPFLSTSPSTVQGIRGIGTSLKWPWTMDQTWYYSYGRHGTNNSAVDFGSGGISVGQRYVRAAASGVVIRYCGPDANGQASLVIRSSTGGSNDDVTGYLHLDGGTLTKNTGDWVNQGDILGQTYGNGSFNTPCGYGDGPHVHFFNGIIPAGSNNGTQITPIDIAGISICGWTLGTDSGFQKSGQTTLYPGSNVPYTSANCGSGTPLSVSWSSPSNGQSIASSSVHLQANPSGGSGGINHVSFSAKWSGTWRGVQDVNSSSWAYDWNMCTAGVPNGDIELGLIAVDNANNQYVYSEHYANYHITKSYNCNPTPRPSANFDAWPTSGNAPLVVAMHIVDTSNITSCSWNYGDGQTGTSCASSHNHTYNNPGSYTVSLTVNGPGGSDSMTRSNYIGVTSPPQALAVSWVSPSNGQTITSSILQLQANPTGGIDGIHHVNFSAKWSGSWHQVQSIFSAPWAFDWNWCSASVPDGDVELGLEVWDMQANKYVYSEHYTNYHITKSYACNPVTVQVTSVTTTDDPGNPKTTFNAGDVLGMRIYVNNATSGQQTITLSWDVYDPNGNKVPALSYDSWQMTAGAGTSWAGFGPTIQSAPVGGTYTFVGTGTYNGNTTSQSTQFTVIAPWVTVDWVSPWFGQTVISSTVHLQANPSGGSGGINHVSFSAKWGGNWHGIQDVYSSPWAYDWNMCGAGVPDGDIELGLIAVDNGGNQYVFSEHFLNYHITKSYSCIASSNVTVASIWTADGNGNAKISFNAGDDIGYSGNIHNSTGITQTAYFVWTTNGPCGSIASWSGNLDTGSGTWAWWLRTSVPNNACPGAYSYRLSVTFNGSTTAKSTAFTISNPGFAYKIYVPFLERSLGASQSSPLRQPVPLLSATPRPVPGSKPAVQ